MGSIAVLAAISIALIYVGRKMKKWNDRNYLLAAFAAFVQTMLVMYAMFRLPWPT